MKTRKKKAVELLDKLLDMIENKPDTKLCEDSISREYILSKAHCCCDDLADDEPCCVDVDDIKNAPPVQPIRHKNATNGDMIKAMFPNFRQTDHFELTKTCEIDYFRNGEEICEIRCSKEWWNAPYKGGTE